MEYVLSASKYFHSTTLYIMITVEYNHLYINDIAELYNDAGWGDFSAHTAELEARWTSSTFTAFALQNDRVIGCIRVLSDRVSVTWIPEILVAKAFRRQGIGRELIEIVLQEFRHTDIYLETFSHAAEFFEKCGLNARAGMVVCSKKHTQTSN